MLVYRTALINIQKNETNTFKQKKLQNQRTPIFNLYARNDDIMPSPLKNLQVVLVRAENPVNIGQSARAMRNFGVQKLILVGGAPHKVPEAYTPGWKARKILMGDFEFILRKLNYKNTPQMPLLNKVMADLTHYFKKSGLDRRELHLFKAFLARVRQIVSSRLN